MEGNEIPVQKDYYKILEVDYDATDEKIRLNYRKLALKWHPDKHQGDSTVTAKFQEINEAYDVLSDPVKRFDYDLTGIYEIDKYTLREYLSRFKGMILTCNGLGINNASACFTLGWSMNLVALERLSSPEAAVPAPHDEPREHIVEEAKHGSSPEASVKFPRSPRPLSTTPLCPVSLMPTRVHPLFSRDLQEAYSRIHIYGRLFF